MQGLVSFKKKIPNIPGTIITVNKLFYLPSDTPIELDEVAIQKFHIYCHISCYHIVYFIFTFLWYKDTQLLQKDIRGNTENIH